MESEFIDVPPELENQIVSGIEALKSAMATYEAETLARGWVPQISKPYVSQESGKYTVIVICGYYDEEFDIPEDGSGAVLMFSKFLIQDGVNIPTSELESSTKSQIAQYLDQIDQMDQVESKPKTGLIAALFFFILIIAFVVWKFVL